MAIKIEEKKPEIPVEIGPLKFSFLVTDESILKMRKQGVEIERELLEVERKLKQSEDDEEGLKQAKDVLRRGFDELFLGEGAFDKIYDMTPSVMVLMNYFGQLSKGIFKEVEAMGGFEDIQKITGKYLKKKK